MRTIHTVYLFNRLCMEERGTVKYLLKEHEEDKREVLDEDGRERGVEKEGKGERWIGIVHENMAP